MNNTPQPSSYEFTIVYTPDELRAYSKVLASRHTLSEDGSTFYFSLPAVAVFGVGFAVLAAFKLSLIDQSAVKPVLIGAYAAFVAGVISYLIFMRRYSGRIYRRLAQGDSRSYAFKETGIHSKRDAVEMQLAWRAIKSIEDHGWAVFFQSGEYTIFIPSRLFADTAERAGFVAAMRACAKAAETAGQAAHGR